MIVVNNKEINYLIEKELTNALKYGKFHSYHEFYAVIKEEIEESNDEIKRINEHMDLLWTGIKCDDEEKANESVNNIEMYARSAIKELIQVLAVIKKQKTQEAEVCNDVDNKD